MKKKSFYRKMGITSMVVSGERPGTMGGGGVGGGGGGDSKGLDVQIFLERMRFQVNQVLAWAKYVIVKEIRMSGSQKGGIKEAERMHLRLPYTDLEMAQKVKEIFGPAYKDGVLSAGDYLQSMNKHYDSVIQRKKDEKKDVDAGLLNPPITFAQVVMGAGGETKKVSQTEPQGSPTEDGERRNDVGMTEPNKGVTKVEEENDGDK